MKKYFLVITLVTIYSFCTAQTYNNEWIDYSKTYYKFKVGVTGLYRITQPALSSIGLGNTPAQNFQLWRNGVEIPLYTSIASGTLGAGDYIDFYGEMNDGKTDTRLYKYDSLQMNDKWSLYTDNAAYFLTVNTTSPNKRFTDPGNNVAGNLLPPETYFIYSLSKYYKEALNDGYGVNLGEIIHSASYETAEGWGSNPQNSGITVTSKNTGLFVYTGGPNATFNARFAGNTSASRTETVQVNGNVLSSSTFSSYNIANLKKPSVPLSALSGDTANFTFVNNGPVGDNVIIVSYQLTYPRLFNFGGASQFYFEMPASSSKYLEITNFNSGVASPVLLDLTNNYRITGIVSGGIIKFVLPASASTRKLVLLNNNAFNIYAVNSFTQRNFINYSLAANQGDYLIISNSNLYNDGFGNNNIEKYRQYRASVDGGGYNAKIIDIDDLIDQFAFGVKHHPSSIRNFAAYALANFTEQPKFLYLIGKGLSYNQFRKNEQDRNINNQALVPTFGNPSSDNLLTATRTGETTTIPIGRLSAITGTEVGYYLDKVKQYELVQKSADQSINGKGWMKNIAHITGGLTDPSLSALIDYYMGGFSNTASDSLFGADIFSYNKNLGVNTAVGTNTTLDQLFSEGISMLTYFGHSSPNSIEFNLDNPQNYNNTGKYPLIIINGCNSGNLFVFDTLRSVSGGTLSEKFVLANQKGSIGYIATTHFGLPTQLNLINTAFYKNMSLNMYGQPLGNLMQATMQSVSNSYINDYLAQAHVEEINLHGDPAIRMNTHTKPDYVIQDSLLTISPAEISVADTKVSITAIIINIGKVVNDSLTVRIDRKLPDNSIVNLGNYRIKRVAYKDSISIILNLNPAIDKGLNQIIVTIDPDNLISELSESNNTVTKSFTIIEDEIRPIWPYEYAIVNNANPVLYGSTANPMATAKLYVMEMDTTALFNSATKITRTISSTGGVIKFVPGITLKDSTVYYWRVAPGPVNAGTRWLKSSFTYINGGEDGFNQSHFYQYKNNDLNAVTIDSSTYKFGFGNKTRKLTVRTGLYPYYTWDQINLHVDEDIVDYYGCVYNALQFAVFDPLTLKPLKNYNVNGKGSYGSYPVCSPIGDGYRNIFEFPYDDTASRRRALQFFDSIPNGYYVTVTNLGYTGNTTFINAWKSDTARLGPGKSLWHKFHELGFHQIDSFYKNLPFLFVFKKGDSISFPVKQNMGSAVNVQVVGAYDIPGVNTAGTVTSPWLGPVNFWNEFKWNEKPDPLSTTQRYFQIIGKNTAGNEVLLGTVSNLKDTSIDYIDATTYPYLKMKMYNSDVQNAKTIQLKNWTLTSDNIPEGALSPNMTFQFKDTLTVDDTLHLKVSFLNISNVLFDSIKVRLNITDRYGVVHVYNNQPNGARLDLLAGGDSVLISYDIPMTGFFGPNQLMLEVNPDNDQPEMFHFNNLLYRLIYVNNSPICPGSSPVFTAVDVEHGSSYQWQVDSGTGYTNIIDGTLYSGTVSNFFTIKSSATSMYGYKYRCIMTDNGKISYTPDYVLKFVSTWKSGVNSSWNTPGNWSCNIVPDNNTDVIIPSGLSTYPVIFNNVNAACRSIKAMAGSSLKLNTGGKLNITGPPGN